MQAPTNIMLKGMLNGTCNNYVQVHDNYHK